MTILERILKIKQQAKIDYWINVMNYDGDGEVSDMGFYIKDFDNNDIDKTLPCLHQELKSEWHGQVNNYKTISLGYSKDEHFNWDSSRIQYLGLYGVNYYIGKDTSK